MRHLFNHVFEHEREEINPATGGLARVSLGPIRGRLRPVSVSEWKAALAAVSGHKVTHVFYCGPEEDIRAGDWIILGRTRVRITGVKNPSHAGHHLECEGTEVQ
jgi:hypothetical protein